MVLKYIKKHPRHQSKSKSKKKRKKSRSHRKIINNRNKFRSKKRMSTKKKDIIDSGKNQDTYDIITLANCPYCSELINLLKEKNIEYKKLEIQNNDIDKKNICNLFVEKIFKIKHKTFPKIFKNGKFIGGLDNFRRI